MKTATCAWVVLATFIMMTTPTLRSVVANLDGPVPDPHVAIVADGPVPDPHITSNFDGPVPDPHLAMLGVAPTVA